MKCKHTHKRGREGEGGGEGGRTTHVISRAAAAGAVGRVVASSSDSPSHAEEDKDKGGAFSFLLSHRRRTPRSLTTRELRDEKKEN